mmetsp:Transcript_19238/g.27417  ORF Transcript_19238/g.27417 Transcript_19238/m.27417 type:complete len:218 (+) Transcript_19238:1854-2507(+)
MIFFSVVLRFSKESRNSSSFSVLVGSFLGLPLFFLFSSCPSSCCCCGFCNVCCCFGAGNTRKLFGFLLLNGLFMDKDFGCWCWPLSSPASIEVCVATVDVVSSSNICFKAVAFPVAPGTLCGLFLGLLVEDSKDDDDDDLVASNIPRSISSSIGKNTSVVGGVAVATASMGFISVIPPPSLIRTPLLLLMDIIRVLTPRGVELLYMFQRCCRFALIA